MYQLEEENKQTSRQFDTYSTRHRSLHPTERTLYAVDFLEHASSYTSQAGTSWRIPRRRTCRREHPKIEASVESVALIFVGLFGTLKHSLGMIMTATLPTARP
jgi:hypothetical protein